MPDTLKPTTGDMMIAFVECYIPGADVREMSALFDEWIAGVRAKAWDEGHEVSCEDEDYICERFHPNPYRKAVGK